ncbi:Uncharacterized protein FWK35_00020705 [Aphis craccivora]|uniref:Uncharacterized protein n=1 Tax=Aphis craccivora TaxID=307492 RepID=A0A6G0YLD2_APHCR|nr:Uncharacterized protein FWK35_00020705 [Aphis craccivora]
MAYKQMYQYNMANNIFEDRHGQKARESFNKTDNIKMSMEKLQPANVNKRFVLNEPTALTRHDVRTKIEVAEEKESDMRIDGLYRPSSRIERLSMPLARWRKPLVRLVAVSKKVDPQIPWCKKGPNAPNNQVKVINPKTQPSAITKTGVSPAALKYEPSDNIKRLAKHRKILKVDDDKQCFSVKPLSLMYKPSPRINQLAMPKIRNREVKK